MTTRPVERRHREAARVFVDAMEHLSNKGAIEFWGGVEDGVAQLLANAEHPAPSAPAEFDPGESPSFGLETWRGPLGLVRLVLRGREHVGYRALGPMQQMPREDFERVFTKCVSPTIEELKVKGPVPAESPQPKAQGDGWVRCEERMPEVGAVVLTMHRRGGMVQAKLCDLYWRIYQQGWVDPVDVTHWRPLPEPPEVP